jgi:protein arginine kinase activator
MVAQLHLCPRCEAKDSGKQEKTCSRCGMTFHQIQARGRFGCPDDYTVFGEEVVKALERYHGSSGHIGKKPREDYF